MVQTYKAIVMTYKIKSTGEIISVMGYEGAGSITALEQFTGCKTHDTYFLSPDINDMCCMINVYWRGDGTFDSVKISPHTNIVKRSTGEIEVWSRYYPPVPADDLLLISKDILLPTK